MNTSLGPTFDQQACLEWLTSGHNFLIADADGASGLNSTLIEHERALIGGAVAGWTAQARERLSAKVLANLERFVMVSADGQSPS